MMRVMIIMIMSDGDCENCSIHKNDETENKVETKSDYYDDLADLYFKLALIKALDDLDYLLGL